MKYATRRLLDSVWTLAYEVVDGEIVIDEHSRDLDIGYEKEHELPQYRLLEDDYRIVEAVCFRQYTSEMLGLASYGDFIDVSNPKYVFDYNK
jgi:hypothetical protein